MVNYEIGETNQSGFDQKGVDAGQHYANLVFSGWLTLISTAIDGTACWAALSLQYVRFAHNPKGDSLHRQRLALA